MPAMYMFAFVFNIPRFWTFRIVYNAARDRFGTVRTDFASNWWNDTFYQTILYYFLTLIIPTLILLYVTFHLIMSLNQAKKVRKEMAGSQSNSKDLTMTLIAVILIFVFCNCFNPTRRVVVMLYEDNVGLCGHFLYPFAALNSTIHIFNAAINMTIYVLLGKNFRTRVLNFLCCRKTEMTMNMSTISNKPPDGNV